MEFMDYLQAVVDGLMFGSVYALIGIGFTLIFGIMNKINMAYAAASFAGAYVSLGVAQIIGLPGDFGLPPFVMFLVSAAVGGVFAHDALHLDDLLDDHHPDQLRAGHSGGQGSRRGRREVQGECGSA